MIAHVGEETANGLGERLGQIFVVRKMIFEHVRDSFFLSPIDSIFFDLHPPTSILFCDMFGNKAGVVSHFSQVMSSSLKGPTCSHLGQRYKLSYSDTLRGLPHLT